ncbi:MAG: Minf_1886 family protein [Verrucomicrobiia bacterium]
MQKTTFEDEIEKIVEKDKRYSKDAYYFVREALEFTQQKLGKKSAIGEERHITGQQLLEGIRDYALSQFGPMTLTVFEEWGIHSCEDFGEIVFNMVDAMLLAKTENDTREDFKNVYDFYEVFQKPFLPPSKAIKPKPGKSPREKTL